jgi:O-antigen/teichoic acid export membrane protein
MGLAPADVAMCCLFLFLNSRAGIVRYVLELPSRSVVRFGLVNALSLLDVLLFACLVFVFPTELTPSLVLRLFVASSIPGFLILFALEQRRHLRLNRVSFAEIRSLLIETVPVAVTMVLLIVHDKADAMILSAFSTSSEVGVFSAAYQSISPLVGTIPGAVVGAMVPAIAHLAVTDRERCSTYARTGLRFMTVAAVGIASVSSCLAPLFIEVVTGGRYADNVLQFATFLWMPVAIFVLVYVQEFSVALGRQRSYTRIAAVLAASTILLSILFVPLWHAEGAALAKLVTVGGAAVMAVILLSRVLEDPRFRSEGLRLSATVIPCALVSFLLPPVIGQFAAAAVACATWLGVSVAMGVLGRDDIALVRRMLKGRVNG